MPKKPKDKLAKLPDTNEKPNRTDTKTVQEIKEDVKSDKLSDTLRQELLEKIEEDVKYGRGVQEAYVTQKRKDLQHYHGENPSILEGLRKLRWMSDRNLGLGQAIADSYQSVLLATCWNPDSIRFVPTRLQNIDNHNNQEKFAKWGMGKQEANAHPQMDDFIHNRVVVGASFFKIYRKVWDEWVDKRIPKKNKEGKTYAWEIKTEKATFSKGVIENIADIDDILMPEYGKNIQELPFFVHILHLDGEIVLDMIERKVFIPVNAEEYKKKLRQHAYEQKRSELGDEKSKHQGLSPETMTDIDIRRTPIDLYEWYGYHSIDNKYERQRVTVDLINREVLALKPVRKVNRSGKIPFSGGCLTAEPGQLRGDSLMKIIAPILNAINNTYNQKVDFQYVTNCPIGFHNPDEGYTKQVYELEPMKSFPVSGDPSRSVYFPNLSRSMAWAEADFRFLLEILERKTGAASYFSVSQQRNKTLGQDLLVDKQSETRFGLWVKRIMEDICEAVSMWFELYQDFPPKNLAERILGEDGKQLFPNLDIDALRGDTVVQMTPDIVAGSRMFRKQLRLQTFQMGAAMLWLHPQVNPKGNWNWCADTLREVMDLSDTDIKRYLGEEPKAEFDEAELDNEWYRFMNGEDFDPPEGETALSLQHLRGHAKQKKEKYDQLPEEHRPNFDAHLFKTMVNYQKFLQNAQKEMMVNQLASTMIMQQEAAGTQPPRGAQPAPAAQPPAPPPGQTNTQIPGVGQ